LSDSAAVLRDNVS